MVRNVPEQLIPEIKWEPLELDWDITVSLFLGTLYVTNYYPERVARMGSCHRAAGPLHRGGMVAKT